MKKTIISISATAFMLTACATGADPSAMTLTGDQIKPVSSSSSLYNAITVGDIQGGEATNPLWVSKIANADFGTALKDSLQASSMLSTDKGEYILSANLVSLDQPMAGLALTVTSSVTYKLTEVSSGEVIYENTIKAAYTAKMSESYIAVTRLRMANEGSIRENIKMMIPEIISAVETHENKVAFNFSDIASEG